MTAESAPSFFFEFLPNIKQLNVCSKLEKTTPNGTSIYFDSENRLLATRPGCTNAQSLATLQHSPTWTELSLHFLTNQQLSKPNILVRQNTLFIQFKDVSLAEEASFPQLRAIDLQSCTNVSCNACGQALHSELGKLVWKDLPNEHWLELLDCWSCHDNEFAPIAERALSQNRDDSSYHHLNNSPSALILPPRGRIYLGLSHLIAHAEDWPVLACPSCSSVLAEPIPSSQNHRQIHKDTLRFTTASGGSIHESTEGLLMNRIRDVIDNSSVYRFLLTTPISSADQLFLVAMNWNVRIKVQEGSWRPALKLGLRLESHCELGAEEYETVQVTPAQLKQISTILLKTHSDLMMSEEVTLPQCPGAGSFKLSLLCEQ